MADAHAALQFAVAKDDRLTTSQVAGRLGVTIRTVLRMAADGRLPAAFKVPGKTGTYLFDRQVVEMFARHLARKAAS